jgi:hypothetical protein
LRYAGIWLTWENIMANGAWALGEFPFPMVRTSCAKCGRGAPQWTEDGDFPARRAHDPSGQQPSAAPAPELDGCTGPNGCILPTTAPGIRGISAQHTVSQNANQPKHLETSSITCFLGDIFCYCNYPYRVCFLHRIRIFIRRFFCSILCGSSRHWALSTSL